MFVSHRVRQVVGAGLMVASLIALGVLAAGAADAAPTRSEAFGLQGASTATVVVRMTAGQLNIASGSRANSGTPIAADALARANFSYDDDRLAPTVDYRIADNNGTLTLTQGGGELMEWPWAGHESNWTLYLNPEIPTEVRIEMGAGEMTLALGGLRVSDVQLDIGAGDTVLDLSGDWYDDARIRVHGGAGNLNVRLPADPGLFVSASLGAGDLTIDDLTRDGDSYINDALGTSETTLTVEIAYGVGDVTIEDAD